jgi:hypothetical protein
VAAISGKVCNIWMLQIFDLSQMFKDLITFRRMSSTNGIQKICVLTTGAQFLAGSSHVRGDFMNTRSNLAVSLNRLRVQNAWEIEAPNPCSSFWTSPYSRTFFGDSPTAPTRLCVMPLLTLDPIRHRRQHLVIQNVVVRHRHHSWQRNHLQ